MRVFRIHTATFAEINQVTVLAIGLCNEISINAQVNNENIRAVKKKLDLCSL